MADGSLIFDTKIDSKGFKDGLGKLGKVAGSALKGTGTLIAGAGAAIAGIGVASLKASIDFESAFAGVRKTVDATEQEFAVLEKGIRDMSKHIPQSASAIAEVAEAAGQLGIKTDNILGFTETMLMLGDATNMSSDQAATALARLANITQMPQTEFDRLGSTIVALGNNLATTESEIVEMGLRLAGTGSQVGMTEDQILALAGAMSSVGINAEAGGSSMSRVMQKINTQVLSGGANLKKFADISGMSADEFSKAWREKPSEAILAFTKGLDEVSKAGGDVTSILKELGINSVQEIDTLLRLAGANETLADALGMSAEAWEENTALATEAEQRYKTTESQIGLLKNNVMDLAISIGDELKESMRGAIDTSIEMTQRLSDAFNEGGFAGLVSELGNVIADVLTKIAGELPRFVDMGKDLILNFLNGISSNRQQLIESVIEIAKSLVNAILEIMPELLETGILLIQELGRGIIEALPELITVAQDCINTLLVVLIDSLPLLIDMGVQILLMLSKGIADMIPTLIDLGLRLILTLAEVIQDNLPVIIDAGVQIITNLLNGLTDMLPNLMDMALTIVMVLMESIIGNAAKLIDAAIVIVDSLINFIFNNLDMIVDFAIKIVMALVEGLLNNLDRLITVALDLVLAIVEGLINNLPLLVNAAIRLVLALANGLIDALPQLIKTATKLIINVISAIANLMPQWLAMGGKLIAELAAGLVKAVPTALRAVSTVAKNIITAIKDIFKAAPSIGSNMVKGIWNGISNVTGWILNKIKGFGRSVMNGIKRIFGIASPSKIMRDEVGKNLTLGIGVGLEEGMPELQRDMDKELAALTNKMKAAVEFESASIGTKIVAGNEKSISGRIIEENNDNSDNSTTITGNTFIIRQESDIEKVAQELDRLRRRRGRGLGVAPT